MARNPAMARRRPTVRLLLMARNPAMARRRPTVRLPLMVRQADMTRQTTMGRRPITVHRYARRILFRMPFRLYAPYAICSGDAVPGPVDGGGCAIRRSMRGLIAATVRHLVQAITVPIEGMI